MEKSTKLLIFDFDGTTANTVPHIVNCASKCVEKFNLKQFSHDDVKKLNGATLTSVFKYLGATNEQLPKIKEYYTKIFFDDISDINLYDGTMKALNELKQSGYTLTLASNGSRSTLIPLLESLDIISLFDKIVCESDVKNKKPSADMVNAILEEFDYHKEETLVLGDTKLDIMMSKNAGCKSCYVCHGEKPNEEILALNPDFVIYNFCELLKKQD